jgi:hypothetical protein
MKRQPRKKYKDKDGQWWEEASNIKSPQRFRLTEYVCDWCKKPFYRRRGLAVAQVRRGMKGIFCKSKCANRANAEILSGQRKGDGNPGWKGGIRKSRVSGGYVYIWEPSNPKANKFGYVAQHRFVMEKILGRYLRKGEMVHHKNRIKSDNRPENLELWTKSHPDGARVEDLLKWAREIIEIYKEDECKISKVTS